MEWDDNNRFTILGKRDVIPFIKMERLSGNKPDDIGLYFIELFIVNYNFQH